MVTQNSDNGWQDPQYAWARNVTTWAAQIRYCEADGINDCDTHTSESVWRYVLDSFDEWYNPEYTLNYSATWFSLVPVDVSVDFVHNGVTITNNGWSPTYTFSNNTSFTFSYSFPDGTTWSIDTFVNRLIKPIIVYDPTTSTPWNVAATLTGDNVDQFTITNNSGSNVYMFTENGFFYIYIHRSIREYLICNCYCYMDRMKIRNGNNR